MPRGALGTSGSSKGVLLRDQSEGKRERVRGLGGHVRRAFGGHEKHDTLDL